MIYYAKSMLSNGKHPTVQEHLEKVSSLASQFGEALSMREEAQLAGLFHDFGKYSDQFQGVLNGVIQHVDHALPGAVFLKKYWEKHPIMNKRGKHVVEAIAGHHDGLRNCLFIERDHPASGKTSSIREIEGYIIALKAFQQDFPTIKLPAIPNQHFSINDAVASMLYTRMLFSCLVDADYSVSASDENEDYLEKTTDNTFDPKELLTRLNAYRDGIRKNSKANKKLNAIRDVFYDQCGRAGEENGEGLFTLTGPTGIGKTLALMHFSLRHCVQWNKKRIIVVLPFLSLTEQTANEYRNVMDSILEDTSQVQWTDETKEYSARWCTAIIITTSVKFFESLFCDQPTDCRKLHHIANSVILFDEAQSLSNEVLGCTLKAVEELCKRYHVTMVFSTATQPNYSIILPGFQPKEIYPDHAALFQKLKRVNVTWRIKAETSLPSIAQEMCQKESVCAIVNLRKHARELFEALIASCPEEECFFLTTDLCAAHRSDQIQTIKERLKAGLPCRVVATQCIEAGVDLDFNVMYRALAPLEAIIQAAGRCNRNGRIPGGGEMTIFVPNANGKKYPETWYELGAKTIEKMYNKTGSIDINNPATIRNYYQILFKDQEDKCELVDAINERDYARTRKEYRLIESRGVQVVVPYGDLEQNYEQIKDDLLKDGLGHNQMRCLAPYTVTCTLPQDKIKAFAEPVPLPARIRKRYAEYDACSGYYMLHPQCLNIYTKQMGLQLMNEGTGPFLL